MNGTRGPVRLDEARSQPNSTWGWVAVLIVLVVFALGMFGLLVALAYSPAVEGLFGSDEPAPQPPQDKIENVPAPDNTISGTPDPRVTEDQPNATIPGLDSPTDDPP